MYVYMGYLSQVAYAYIDKYARWVRDDAVIKVAVFLLSYGLRCF
jgi:hypothetical protein